MKNKLPTESELRARLEKRAEMYREDGLDARVCMRTTFKDGHIKIYCDGKWVARTDLQGYHPDPQPPGDLEAVLVWDGIGDIVLRLSKGIFLNARLMCYSLPDSILLPESSWRYWYNPKTGEHSDGFPVDRLPERFRK